MDQKNLLRVGVIGCGRIGSLWDESVSEKEMATASPRTHALAYRQNKSAELVAFCDTDRSRAEAAAKKWNAGFYSDQLNEFAKQNLDVISICTPPETRLETLKLLAETNRDSTLLIEKPLAKNLKEAHELKTVLKKFTGPAVINYSRRFAPGIQELKTQLARGDWGHLQSGTGYYGNGFMNNGTHMLDLICYLLDTPQKVSPQKVTQDDRVDSDQTLSALLQFKNGSLIQLHGLNHQNFTVFELDLILTKGRVRLTERAMTIQSQKIIDDPVYEGFKILGEPVTASSQYEKCLQNAVNEAVQLHQGVIKTPSCGVDDALHVTQIVEDTRRSLK